MKNKFFFLAILFIPFLISCGDDDNPIDNGFAFNNTYYDMNQLIQYKQGDGKNTLLYFENGTYNITNDEFTGTGVNLISIAFQYDSGADLPTTGTYTFDGSGNANGTFTGYIQLGYDTASNTSTLMANFTSGTVTVGQVNGDYVLDFDVQTASGNIQGELNQQIDYVITQ